MFCLWRVAGTVKLSIERSRGGCIDVANHKPSPLVLCHQRGLLGIHDRSWLGMNDLIDHSCWENWLEG